MTKLVSKEPKLRDVHPDLARKVSPWIPGRSLLDEGELHRGLTDDQVKYKFFASLVKTRGGCRSLQEELGERPKGRVAQAIRGLSEDPAALVREIGAAMGGSVVGKSIHPIRIRRFGGVLQSEAGQGLFAEMVKTPGGREAASELLDLLRIKAFVL